MREISSSLEIPIFAEILRLLKVLFLTSRYPFPLEKGDKLRVFHLMREISKNHEVHLGAIHDRTPTEYEYRQLDEYCREIRVFPLRPFHRIIGLIRSLFNGKPFQVGYYTNPKIHRKINKWLDEENFDLVFTHMIRVGEYVRHRSDFRVLDYMDALSKGMERREESEKFPLKTLVRSEFKRLKQYEADLMNDFDRYTMISDQDKQCINHPKKEEITVLPNGVDMDFWSGKADAPKKYDLLYCGNMKYPPNIESAKFTAEKVLPILHQKDPKINFIIAGADPAKSVRQLESENVVVTGWMDDIREAFNASKIMVAPMLISIGLQNKILQGMAMRVPCVISSLANNAIQAPGDCVMIADEPEDYSKAIQYLLENPDKAHEMADRAYAFCSEKYGWKYAAGVLEKMAVKRP
jgi:sugar transferase (PEP-CTERM/EpsH1 system associated)